MLKRPHKILLSIPPIIALLFGLSYIFPSIFSWFAPSMKVYYATVFTIQGVTLVQLTILMVRLWRFKKLDRSKKGEWTWLLLLFSQITSLIYIWKKDDEFYQKNWEV